MQKWITLIFVMTVTMLSNSCLGVTQTFTPPTAPPTSVPTSLPPALPTLAPLPVPTITRQAVPTPQTDVQDPILEKLIRDAQQDLMQRVNVPASAITVVSAQPVEWRDTSLGCPVEGMMYAQVITPGYLIVLEAKGQTYNYHASTTRVIYCEK